MSLLLQSMYFPFDWFLVDVYHCWLGKKFGLIYAYILPSLLSICYPGCDQSLICWVSVKTLIHFQISFSSNCRYKLNPYPSSGHSAQIVAIKFYLRFLHIECIGLWLRNERESCCNSIYTEVVILSIIWGRVWGWTPLPPAWFIYEHPPKGLRPIRIFKIYSYRGYFILALLACLEKKKKTDQKGHLIDVHLKVEQRNLVSYPCYGWVFIRRSRVAACKLFWSVCVCF